MSQYFDGMLKKISHEIYNSMPYVDNSETIDRDWHLARLFLANAEAKGDVRAIRNGLRSEDEELLIHDLECAKDRFNEDGQFRSTVQQAGVRASISNTKMLLAMNNLLPNITNE